MASTGILCIVCAFFGGDKCVSIVIKANVIAIFMRFSRRFEYNFYAKWWNMNTQLKWHMMEALKMWKHCNCLRGWNVQHTKVICFCSAQQKSFEIHVVSDILFVLSPRLFRCNIIWFFHNIRPPLLLALCGFCYNFLFRCFVVVGFGFTVCYVRECRSTFVFCRI